MAEYGHISWTLMVDHWHTVNSLNHAKNISMFYAHRDTVYEQVQTVDQQVRLAEKDYEW